MLSLQETFKYFYNCFNYTDLQGNLDQVIKYKKENYNKNAINLTLAIPSKAIANAIISVFFSAWYLFSYMTIKHDLFNK